MHVTEDTKRVAQRVYDYLMLNPNKHVQSNWVGWQEGGRPARDGDTINDENLCNTTLCAAGAAVFVEKGVEGLNRCLDSTHDDDFEEIGAELLGLDETEAAYLFYNEDEESVRQAILAIAQGDKNKFEHVLYVLYGV